VQELNLFVYERIPMKTYEDCIIFLLAKAYQKAHIHHQNLQNKEIGLTKIY